MELTPVQKKILIALAVAALLGVAWWYFIKPPKGPGEAIRSGKQNNPPDSPGAPANPENKTEAA